jgi:hypothetical protein
MLSNKRFSLLVAALLMGSVPAVASDVVSTINELPAIEIPAKAANAVRAAPAEKQLELSRQILTAVLKWPFRWLPPYPEFRPTQHLC